MRKAATLLLAIVILIVSSLIALPPANADESKTIIVPDDYPAISSAIGNATDGDTIFVKKGNYEEKQLIVNKSLSLIGEGAGNTRINLNPPYVENRIFTSTYSAPDNSIKVNSDGFEMSGFTIATPSSLSLIGDGIKILNNNITAGLSGNGDEVQITGNTLSGGVHVKGSNQIIAQNTIKAGIEVNGCYNEIVDNVMSGGGLQIVDMVCNNSLIFNNTIIGNGWPGIHLEYAVRGNIIAQNNLIGCGIELETRCSFNTIFANKLNGAGFSLMGFNNTFYANEAIGVNIGGTHGGVVDAAYNSFYSNNFLSNVPELRVYTKAPGPLFWDNGKEGNHWSSYHGADANNDGIGDVPYKVTTAYSYYDGSIREEAIVDCGQDNFPLMVPFDISSVPIELPDWITPPSVRLISPKNTTYTFTNITLEFTVNKQTTWIGYSLDGQDNVTVSGNTTLSGLFNGLHNITIYAKDEFDNIGFSETINFTIAVPEPEPFPTTVIVASIVTVAIVGTGLSVYFKKRKH